MNLVMQKNNELSAILEVSRVLTASFDLEKNLAAVMKILASHLDMQRGGVFLMDSISKEIGIVAARMQWGCWGKTHGPLTCSDADAWRWLHTAGQRHDVRLGDYS